VTQVDPHVFVIFGGTRDLATRKLFPALYRLIQMHALPVQILAVGRDRELNNERFRQVVQRSLAEAGAEEADLRQWPESNLHYLALGDGEVGDYRRLAARLHSLEADHDLPGNRVFYLALPPTSFPTTMSS
jgi:glucose-6-phosphate 1-dehydrogenase